MRAIASNRQVALTSDMQKKRPSTKPAIKVMMQPQEANIHKTIFGGTILSQIDLAGAVHCRSHGCRQCVTIAMKEVEFKLPIYVGDVVSFHGSTVNVGRTSITVKVDVWAHRHKTPGECVWVTEATVTYVNVDEDLKPVPVPLADPIDPDAN